MAKHNKALSASVTQEEREPVDLLEQAFVQRNGAARENSEVYTVEAGGGSVELTLEQLLELARLCLELNIAEAPTDGGAQQALSDVPELLEFVQNYPDVKTFPPEVEEQIVQGKKPLDAYRAFENEQLRKKLRALEQNESNRKQSLGSLKGEADADELDDLMAIYNSVFK